MWEGTLETQQSESVTNKIMSQTTKPELAQYLHASLFVPTTASLLKAMKNKFMKTMPGIIEKIVKKHLEKSKETIMIHLNMRRQGLNSTREKPLDTDLEDKSKTNVVFCTTVDPSITKEGKFYSDICRRFPTTSSRGNKYICIMYVYYCNSILTT